MSLMVPSNKGSPDGRSRTNPTGRSNPLATGWRMSVEIALSIAPSGSGGQFWRPAREDSRDRPLNPEWQHEIPRVGNEIDGGRPPPRKRLAQQRVERAPFPLRGRVGADDMHDERRVSTTREQLV